MNLVKIFFISSLLLSAAGCGGENIAKIGQGCSNEGSLQSAVCENNSPVLLCDGSNFVEAFATPSGLTVAPPDGCTFECSNPDGEGTWGAICPDEA